MYTIITPTYKGHFCYIKKYLDSFCRYTIDKNKYKIVFTISLSEKEEFLSIVNKYRKDLIISVLYFEDLLAENHIKQTPEELLQKYGRFTFQTLKKFYTMLSCDTDYFLVIDSESMVVRKTSIVKLFEHFFKCPYIIGSKIDVKKRHPIVRMIAENTNYLLNKKCNIWFLEHFVWFYEKKILIDLFKEIGSPIAAADKIYNKNKCINEVDDIRFGIFEIILYQSYLFKHRQELHYNFICIDDELIGKMGKENYRCYQDYFYHNFGGHCGLIEQVCLCLNKKNYMVLGHIFEQNNINIIRCEFTDIKNYRLQKKFLKIVRPNILAASQNHLWGINNNFSNRFNIFIRNSKSYEKLKKHIKNFLFPFQVIENSIKKFLVALLSGIKRYIVRPLCYFFKWITEPFSILFYLFKLVMRFMKIF